VWGFFCWHSRQGSNKRDNKVFVCQTFFYVTKVE